MDKGDRIISPLPPAEYFARNETDLDKLSIQWRQFMASPSGDALRSRIEKTEFGAFQEWRCRYGYKAVQLSAFRRMREKV